jgi:hypothetical protein
VLAGRKKYALIAALVVAGLAGTSIALWTGESSRPAAIREARHSSRPPANWDLIRVAASLRENALGQHRTAFHRAYAAYMGLSTLLQIRHRLRGSCATAVSYLYDNLLDLHDAYTGEDWTALRQAVAREPSLAVCAPRRATRRRPHVRYVE